MAKKKAAKPKAIWVEIAPGRQKWVRGEDAKTLVDAGVLRKKRGGVARHSNKRLYSFGCHASQVADKQSEAVQAGFKNIRFTPDGRCYSDNPREADEYAYFQKQYVNLDSNHSIPTWRQRELDRAAGRH